jgi:uncharacterized protein (TIGR03435 family)
MTAGLLIDHLWQSTLVAAALALLTLAFRRAPAHVRYGIWFAASLKFLVPFAALSSLGARLDWRQALPPAPPEWSFAIEAVSQPFSTPPIAVVLPQAMQADAAVPFVTIAGAIWIAGCAILGVVWLLRWRRVSAAVRSGTPIVSGRVHDAARQLAAPNPLTLISSDTSLEPGVFGIVRPVLLWPRAIDTALDDEQVQAVLAHEMVHVRRRDNLTAAIHMIVEAAFWFHPLVWWIGGRLVDERERACDEEVVRLGNDPDVYAESLLRTCRFFAESGLTCVPGVNGSDLKKRIEHIMTHHPGRALGRWSKLALTAAAIATMAAPVTIGALTIPPRVATFDLPDAARSFQTATVNTNTTGANRVMMRVAPGGAWEATNVTLESMIRLAFRIQESQLAGGPDWIYDARFDIVAKSPQGAPGSEFGLRMQSLLRERFNLQFHRETRQLSVYALVASRDGGRGPRLTPSTVDCVAFVQSRRIGAGAVAPGPGEQPTCGTIQGPGRLRGGGATMQQLAQALSLHTGRMVIDQTGLSGAFDYDLEFKQDPALQGRGPGGGLPQGPPPPGTATVNSAGAPIFTAVQEQLGLRLESQLAPVDVMVVDSAAQPTQR